MRQYRIYINKHDQKYPHVRFKKWYGWSKWKAIGKHVEGYGLYSTKEAINSKTYVTCLKIIADYNIWVDRNKSSDAKDRYINIQIK